MSVSKPGNPNDLTEVTSSDPANPTSLTGVANEVLPRPIQPYINFDFANNVYEIQNEGKSLSDAVTYSRASSATFIDRYIDENDQYQYYLNKDFVGTVTNKVLYSEDYGNSVWTKNNTTVTPNAEINPVTNKKNASLITNSLAVESRIEDTLTLTASATVNMSAYVKANVGDWMSILIWDNSANGTRHYFNIREGYLGSSTSFGSGLSFYGAQILYVGNGWYRVSATTALPATTSWTVRYQFTNGDAVTTSNGNESYYIWGAQLTETVKAEPYVQTFDVAASKTFSATPRLEYDAATGESLGYLAERAITNINTYSEVINLATGSWTENNSSPTLNDEIAPDLTKSATKLADDGTNGVHSVFKSFTVTSSQDYTFSFFAKAGSLSQIRLLASITGGLSTNTVIVDLVNGVITPSTSAEDSITDVGNGWYRVSKTYTTNSTTMTPQIRLYNGSTDTYTGAADYLYLWGVQLENSPYETSYIRTGSSTVARSADIMTASSPLQPFGTYQTTYNYFGSSNNRPGARFVFDASNGGGSNRNYLYNTGGSSAVNIVIGNVTVQLDNAQVVTDSSFNEIATTFQTNDFKIYEDGVLVDSASAGTTPIIDEIKIGSSYLSTLQIDGHLKQLTFYPAVLTANEVSKL